MAWMLRLTGLLSGLVLVCTMADEDKSPPDPAVEFAKRAERLAGKKEARGWLALADFCEEHGLVARRVEALKRAVELDPHGVEAHERLDEKKRNGAWVPADEAEAAEIAEKEGKGLVFYGTKWIPAKEAEKHRAEDRKAVGWDCDFRMETPHLLIWSTRSTASTWKVAEILENEIEAYRRLYGGIWPPDPKMARLKVYLFGDRETFEKQGELIRRSPMPRGMGGFYWSNLLKTSCRFLAGPALGHTGDAHLTLVSVHEMVHALDHLMSDVTPPGSGVPTWVMEGRAEYFRFGLAGRRLVMGGLQRTPDVEGYSRALAEGLRIPLAALVCMDQRTFEADPAMVTPHYARSWSLVHFLFHGEGGRYAAGFKAYLKGLPAKRSREDFEKAVGKIPEIEAGLETYTKGVLLPGLIPSR